MSDDLLAQVMKAQWAAYHNINPEDGQTGTRMAMRPNRFGTWRPGGKLTHEEWMLMKRWAGGEEPAGIDPAAVSMTWWVGIAVGGLVGFILGASLFAGG